MRTVKRYHIMWVGSYTKRVLKPLSKINPDKIIFLLESKSDEWKEFQEESLNFILDYLGKTFQENNRTETVTFPFQESEDEILKMMFDELYSQIDQIKNESEEESEITIDVTAAPKMVNFLITFIAMALSDRNTRIRIVYTSKGIESTPSNYASRDSKFCDNTELKLCEFREIEKNDPGGEITCLELPIINFQLFNISNDRTPFLITIFRKIPGKKSPLKHNGTISSEIMESDNDIITKYVGNNNNKRSINNKITKGLIDFKKWGIIELEKEGQKYYVRKTWAGELIDLVIERLYNSIKYPE